MALTERLSILLETAGVGGVVGDFKKIGVEAEKLGSSLAGKSGFAGKIGGAFDTMKSGLAAVGPEAAIAGTVLAGFGAKAVEAYVGATQSALMYQRATGATAEQSSAMSAAFERVGISAEGGSGAMFMLAKRVDAAQGKLAGFGVTVARDTKGGVDLSATLLNISDAYTSTTDPARRAELLTAAFGKRGAELVPILEKGRNGIKELYAEAGKEGRIFSQEDLDRGRQFKEAMDRLHASFQKILLAVGPPLVDALTQVSDALSKISDHSGGLLKVWGWWINHTPNLITAAHLISSGIDAVSGSSDDAAKATKDFDTRIQQSTDDIDAAKKAATDQAEALDKLQSVLLADTQAVRDHAAAQRAAEIATREMNDAKAKLDVLIAKGAVDQKAVTAATREEAAAKRELKKADEDVEKATRAVTDAQIKLNDAIQPATVEELTTAFDGLVSAQLELKDANKSAGDALDDYNKKAEAYRKGTSLDPASADELTIALGDVSDTYTAWQKTLTDGKSKPAEVAKAHKAYTDSLTALDKLQKRGIVTQAILSDSYDNLTRANLRVDGANATVTKSTSDYQDVLHQGSENDPAVIAAREHLGTATETLATANEHVATATQNVNDKTAALGLALAGDPNFKSQVSEARQEVADKTQHVADAQFNVSSSAYTLETAQKKANDALATGGVNAGILLQNLQGMLALDPQMAGFLAPLIALLSTPPTAPAAPGTPGKYYLPRQHGGPVTAGGAYIVGEAGPEKFIPGTSGTIVPNGGGGATYYLTVNAMDGRDAAPAVMAAIKQWESRNGTSWRN